MTNEEMAAALSKAGYEVKPPITGDAVGIMALLWLWAILIFIGIPVGYYVNEFLSFLAHSDMPQNFHWRLGTMG